MVPTDRDPANRKGADDALRDSEERYRTLLRVIPVPFCIVDAEGVLVYMNDRFSRMFGYTPEDMHTLQEWWVQAYPDAAYRAWAMETWDADMKRAVLEGTDILPREYRVTCKNGDERIEEISGIILGDQFIATFLDVTDRRLVEEAFREANRKLNILNSITRHDILNQLMGLNGYIELMKMKTKDPELLGYLKKEESAATAIQRQIEFTRFYQDIGMTAAEWHDVEKTIATSIQQLRPHGITIDLHVAGLEIYADPLVEKVFYNLMENSLRHGDHVTRMEFTYTESADGLVLVYHDDGVGITAEDRKRLFQKGFGKNTGLGLFLSREILLITGIVISENGEAGKGVRFEVRVPKGAYRFRHH
ncbi:MAG: PAS domain-containing sensor histidine kinase [Methanoregula sp.]|jgi:PAS domain S-box-containing protein|uniref:ATP-binding protein n=1 Tax=Methanoregula sp. TaxID=2052170 RepID=UPI0025E37452|nr:PAS domain-containing sensor histidine kinase [Methanoregula sp.]MCK9632503.1 PAS domain-containing sensor histidine kinase [Methanoregula sp.]